MYFIIPRATTKKIVQRNMVKIIMDKLRQNMNKNSNNSPKRKTRRNGNFLKGDTKPRKQIIDQHISIPIIEVL